MNYPLMKKEIKDIEDYIDSFPSAIPESDMPYGNKVVFDFLHKNGFFKPSPNLSSLNGDYSSELEKWYCLENKTIILEEIRCCNKKSRSTAKREWKIGISSAIIGGLFGIISTVISTKIIG